MGAKLLTWVGGLLAFLAFAWFFKYSIDNNLISPQLRVALGFLAGTGLVIGGCVLKRKAYEVTAQTLCATGVVILYAASFASRTYLGVSANVVFALMVLITATAFTLAVGLNAMVVAILGILGGFLTPPLLSTGVDRPFALFGYIALLEIGLLAVALKRRWHFLSVFGAVGTVLMQIGWFAKFFTVGKVLIAMPVFLGFDVLFLLAFVVAARLRQRNAWVSASAFALPLVTLLFVFPLLGYAEIGTRPGVVFCFLLGADLCVLGMVLLRHPLTSAHLISGGMVFLALSAWTVRHLTDDLLNWALAGYLVFAVLHSVFPIVLERLRPGQKRAWWGHMFPPVALVLVMIPLFKCAVFSWLLWPCVLLIDVIAIGLALLTASLGSIIAVLVLTVLATAIWVLRIPAELTGVPTVLLVVGGFAVFFFVAGLFAGDRILARLEAAGGHEGERNGWQPAGRGAELRAQVPALSAVMPFLLLILASVRLPLTNPSSIYGLGLLLVVLLLGVVRMAGVPVLTLVGLGCVLALEATWHAAHFSREAAGAPLAWNLAFTAVFMAFPFVFWRRFQGQVLPWAASALAGPVHFYLVHRVVKDAFPNDFMGALPAAFAVPMLLGLAFVVKRFPEAERSRNAVLAWLGGSALFFVTLIFPIQWEKQWITLGWALEGVALIWLFERVPHRGLPATGVVLLVVAFLRLANPLVFDYHPRSAVRIFNWYLYAYGAVTVCLLVGARLLAPARHRVFKIPAAPVLYALGTVLAFLLMNIEIADYFSEGTAIEFRVRGNLARNMTYSLAWALFALGLLSVGVWKRVRPARYASLALLGVTVLKLFFHDLANLQALYRVGALLGVGVISILASVLYQRFFSVEAMRSPAGRDERPTAGDGQGQGINLARPDIS